MRALNQVRTAKSFPGIRLQLPCVKNINVQFRGMYLAEFIKVKVGLSDHGAAKFEMK
jgi:hypothetical protein